MPLNPKTISLTGAEVAALILALNSRFSVLIQYSDDDESLPEMDIIDNIIEKLRED